MEEEFDDIECKICNQIILKPALLPCKHQFCCYCIRSILNKHPQKIIVCPLCRKNCSWAPLNKLREKQVIQQILKRQKIYVFKGEGYAVNNHDQNKTKARSFYCILKGDYLIGDIIWGDGTQHNSFVDQVGRGQGKARLHQDGSLQLIDYRYTYSNGPNQLWKGTYKNKGNCRFQLQGGSYDWQVGNRVSSGKLTIQLRQIQLGDTEQQDL